MDLHDKYEQWDKAYCAAWDEYVDLHKQLDQFRGILLTEELAQTKINPLLKQIQEKFFELEPSFRTILHRGAQCQTAINEYKKFIAEITATETDEVNIEAKA